jgi:hypothetical protein
MKRDCVDYSRFEPWRRTAYLAKAASMASADVPDINPTIMLSLIAAFPGAQKRSVCAQQRPGIISMHPCQ